MGARPKRPGWSIWSQRAQMPPKELPPKAVRAGSSELFGARGESSSRDHPRIRSAVFLPAQSSRAAVQRRQERMPVEACGLAESVFAAPAVALGREGQNLIEDRLCVVLDAAARPARARRRD